MNTPRITYRQALKAFGRPIDIARALKVERASVAEWKAKGELPEGRVWQCLALWPEKWPHLKRFIKKSPSNDEAVTNTVARNL